LPDWAESGYVPPTGSLSAEAKAEIEARRKRLARTSNKKSSEN
jgi:hypothetical protein